MSLILMDSSVVRDKKILVEQARGLASTLLYEAFSSEQKFDPNIGDFEVNITFSKESLISLGTLLYQLADQAQNITRS